MGVLIFTTETVPAGASGEARVVSDSADGGRLKHVDAAGVVNVLPSTQKYNYLRNSGHWFAQRQAPATATAYSSLTGRAIAADGFGITNENASASYRRVDTIGALEAGRQSRFWGEYLKTTTTGKLVVTQVVEGATGANLRGRTVRLTAWIKGVVGTPVMRLGLIAHTGTVDTIAVAFMSALGASGTDPTLGTSLAYLTPKAGITGDNCTASGNAFNCITTGAWQRFSGVFDVPTTMINLIPAVWTNNQLAATNGFGLSQMLLTDGYEVQDWAPQSHQEELDRVLRFYQKTFSIDTAPIANAGPTTGALQAIVGKAGAVALAAQGQWRYETRLRAAATTLTRYNPGAAGVEARRVSGAAAADQTATATANSTEQSVDWTCTGDAAGTVGDRAILHMSADAEL